MTEAMARARSHIILVLGPEEAGRVIGDCLREAGISDVTETAHLYMLGTVLMKRGGFLEVVGRYLRVQAISRECADRPSPNGCAPGRYG